MWRMLILVCQASLAYTDCMPSNALDVMRGQTVRLPQQCAFLGQAQLATTSIVPEWNKSYTKIICVRDHRGWTNTASNAAINSEVAPQH